MKWMEVKIVFDCEDTIQATDLIANAFHESEVKGVVVEDPSMEEPPEGWGENGIKGEHYGVIGYLLINGTLEKKCIEIEKKLHMVNPDAIIARSIHKPVYAKSIDGKISNKHCHFLRR